MLTLSDKPTFSRIWNTWLAKDAEHIQIEAGATFIIIFRSSYEYLIYYISEDSRAHSVVKYGPPSMLTIQPRIIIVFQACSLISKLKYMSFWYLYLEPQPMHVPIEYRCLIKILGSPTLLGVHFGMGECVHGRWHSCHSKVSKQFAVKQPCVERRVRDGPGHQLICIGAKGRDITCPN